MILEEKVRNTSYEDISKKSPAKRKSTGRVTGMILPHMQNEKKKDVKKVNEAKGLGSIRNARPRTRNEDVRQAVEVRRSCLQLWSCVFATIPLMICG